MNDQTLEQRKTQAGRCYNCGVPFCQTGCTLGGKPFGCPLHNLIPEWNDMLRKGNAAHALSRLLKVNCFPEFTGRVCPAFCQRACIRSEVDGAVTIRENELFLAEYGFEKGIIVPAEPKVRSGWTVAVIGSGPMGLTAAHLLSSRGHSVTVFEQEAEPGGQLISAIPKRGSRAMSCPAASICWSSRASSSAPVRPSSRKRSPLRTTASFRAPAENKTHSWLMPSLPASVPQRRRSSP